MYITKRHTLPLIFGSKLCINIPRGRYMRMYGFLLKPYKNNTYYWEVFNIARKAALSIIVKLNTHNPIVCASYAMAVLFIIIAHQAHVRPYKYATHKRSINRCACIYRPNLGCDLFRYEKHNNCAITVLTTSLLNFFSSIVSTNHESYIENEERFIKTGKKS